ERLIALVVRKSIDDQRNSGAIQNLNTGHVHLVASRITQIKREEVEVVVGIAGETVPFNVAANDRVVAGIEHRPRRCLQADAARVEIFEGGAALSKNMREPG